MTTYSTTITGTSGLTHYYPFNSNGNDAVGSSNFTIATGYDTTTVGMDGNGLNANSTASKTGSFLSSTLTSMFGSAYSVEFWFRYTTAGQSQELMRVADDVALEMGTDGKILYYYKGTSATTAASWGDGKWHHLVITRDGSRVTNVYIDKTSVISFTAPTGSPTAANFYFSGSQYTGQGVISGKMDEVALYNVALSTADINAHYAAGPVTPNDVAAATATADIAALASVDTNTVAQDTTVSTDNYYNADGTVASAFSSTFDYVETKKSTTTTELYSGFTFPTIVPSGGEVVKATLTVKIQSDTGSQFGRQIGVYSGIGATPTAGPSDTYTLFTDASDGGNLVTFDVTSLVSAGATTFSIRPVSGSAIDIKFDSVDKSGGTPAKVSLLYVPHTNVALDLSVLTATADVAAPTANVGIAYDASALTLTAGVSDPAIDLTTAYDAATATSTADVLALDGVDATTSPDVLVDVPTLSLSLTLADPTVSFPTAVDLTTLALTADVNDATFVVTQSANIEVDAPVVNVVAWRPTDVNGEPVLATETEDRYFLSTMAGNPTAWWRLDETSGTTVVNRTNDGLHQGFNGAYNNVTIGLHDGPDGRHNVHFTGQSSISEIEPSEEIVWQGGSAGSGMAYELTFRTSRKTEFIMGGRDISGFRPTGIAQTLMPYTELWLNNGHLEWRYYFDEGSPTPTTVYSGFTDFADGHWHHLMIIIGDSQEFWVDGKLELRKRQQRFGFGVPDQIGGRGGVEFSQWFQGDMTEIVIYEGYKLGPFQIKRQYDMVMGHDPVYPEIATVHVEAEEATAKGNKRRMLYINIAPMVHAGSGLDPGASQLAFVHNSNLIVPQTAPTVGPAPWQDAFGKTVVGPTASGYYELFQYQFPDIPDTFQLYGYEARDLLSNRLRYDAVTDNERLLDLDIDVNLDDFDCIMIGNYPWTDNDWELLDDIDRENFGDALPARKQVERLIGQVRDAVIGGKRLYVNDPGVAIAMGIVDRIEYVPAMRERANDSPNLFSQQGFYDARAAAIDPWNHGSPPTRYEDAHMNQFQRVRKLVDNLTDVPSYIQTDFIHWLNVDGLANPPEQWAYKLENRLNGLQLGDEFYMQGPAGQGWIAAPIADVKVGSVVTSFSSQVWNLNRHDDNPYRDYAVSIVVQPGDLWHGQTVQGKVYCNFTEAGTNSFAWENYLTAQVLDPTNPFYHETAETLPWDFSSYRGVWQQVIINQNQASGAGDISTNSSTGKITTTNPNSGTGQTAKPRVDQLSQSFWSDPFEEIALPVFKMANRGWKWLVGDIVDVGVEASGDRSTNLDTVGLTAQTLEPTVQTVQSTVVDVAPASVIVEAWAERDATETDVTVLALTPGITANILSFATVIEPEPATITADVEELELNVLEGLPVAKVILPRGSITLYLEERD